MCVRVTHCRALAAGALYGCLGSCAAAAQGCESSEAATAQHTAYISAVRCPEVQQLIAAAHGSDMHKRAVLTLQCTIMC